MKIIERDILPFQEDDFFKALRNKVDYARLVILSARSLLINYSTKDVKVDAKMTLIIDTMSRLFFIKQNKYFSVSFPFTVLIAEGEDVEISSYLGKEVNNRSISAVLSILDNNTFKLNPSTIDFYIDSDYEAAIGLALLEEIFLFEPSYIRYDNDPARQNGKRHPLFHLDVNYSSAGVYKLGLNEEITIDHFKNLLNTTTDCSFVIDL